MPHLRNLIRNLSPAGAQRRFRRARPGSVLILVVTLLVLMALIGTAWISTTQIDRYSAQQNSYNTQIDLLLEGTKNLVQAAILDDIFEAGQLRPAPNSVPDDSPPHRMPPPPTAARDPWMPPATFDHLDSPLRDYWLADRHPRKDTNSNNSPVLWNAISWPSVGSGGTPAFERPDHLRPVVLEGYKHEFTFEPISLPFNGKPRWPFLQVRFNGNVRDRRNNVMPPIPAADTDGDGIADAGLWRLPVGQINGVTYFAACRIIDGNSALNASVAWGPHPLPGQPNYGFGFNSFFPTNVNLFDSLTPADRGLFAAFNVNCRFGGAAMNLTPLEDPEGGPNPVARDDFDFTSSYEAMWMQLGRRLGNPGYISGTTKYTALPVGESAAMAYRFCLINPSASPSQLERFLPASTYLNSPSLQYAPSEARIWQDDNFKMVPVATPRPVPLRSMLVANNGVSNATPARLIKRSFPPNSTDPPRPSAAVRYQFGDWFDFNGRAYVCIRPFSVAAGAAPDAADYLPGIANLKSEATWAPQPWLKHPAKISVNTGNFGQLWPAYYAVMADTPLSPAFPSPRDVTNTNNALRPRMFRSTVRNGQAPPPADPNTPYDQYPPDYLRAYEMMMIRSALAAVNTMDLRDSDHHVTSRTIRIMDPITGRPKYHVTVFGTERQPYITEIFVNNDLKGGYVAIELHNPYPQDIKLNNWQLAKVLRAGQAGSRQALSLLPIAETVTNWGQRNGPEVPIIPAFGYVVLASHATPPAHDPPIPAYLANPTAQTNGVPKLYVLPTLLQEVLNHEVVLLRPRRADGVLTGNSNSFLNRFREQGGGGAGQPRFAFTEGLVPVDSYDFTGLVDQASARPNGGHTWHYMRPSDPSDGKAWRFVYPGPYDAAAPPGTPRQSGTLVTTPSADPNVYTPPSLASIGLPDAMPIGPNYIARPLQVANVDAPGPYHTAAWQPDAAPNGAPGPVPPVYGAVNGKFAFPYGAFPRNGDILQVTFTGAYTIREATDSPNPRNVFDLRDQSEKTLLEINPITLDSAFVDDGDPDDDFEVPATDANPAIAASEQLGRFCPILGATVNDYLYTHPAHRYSWAMDLFDYLTVHSPQHDFLPDVDPTEEYKKSSPNAAVTSPNFREYPGTEPSPDDDDPLYPQPVASTAAVPDPTFAGQGLEDEAPVEGLINLNTASWRVLATVPFVDPGLDFDGNGARDNIDIAQAIVHFRDVDGDPRPGVSRPHGPFRSIFDLNLVPRFRDAWGPANDTFDADDNRGDLSPFGQGNLDLVGGDFERRFLTMTRASNFLTTRSDTFTVYIQVQGWRGYGTPNPELVVQRRAAFLADRTAVNALNATLKIENVPTD